MPAQHGRWHLSLAAPLDVASARLALFGYLAARRRGAPVGIRVAGGSDDGTVASDSIVEDLRWLGFEVDEKPVLVSSRTELYRAYAQQLVFAGRTQSADGTTRLVVPPGQTIIDDAVTGRVAFDNGALGDIVLLHPADTVAPTFAQAIDDALLSAPLVVRDARQLEHTARSLLVLDALALTAPRYAHVGPLLPDLAGGELPAIAQLRRAGFLPEAVIDHLALLGWSSPTGDESSSWPQRIAGFSLDRIHESPAHLNQARLRALNARALRALPVARLAELVATAMQRAGLLEDPIPEAARRWIDTFLAAYGTQFTTLGEALGLVADLRAEAVMVPALELERLRNRQVVFYLDAVGQYVDAQAELRDLPLDHDLPVIAQEFGIARDDAFAALRMALTGTRDGAPLGLLFALLGHDRILIRIGAISSHLLHGRGLEPIKYGPGGVPFQTIQPTGRSEP